MTAGAGGNHEGSHSTSAQGPWVRLRSHSGVNGRCEIVLWDRPHESYFSLRCRWTDDSCHGALAEEIRAQLLKRLEVSEKSDVFADRSPRRPLCAPPEIRDGAA